MKMFFRILVGIMAVAFVLEIPSAYAIFGIRAARTAIAARKAKQMTSSSDSDADKAYAEEKARFEKPIDPNEERGLKYAVR
jgi:hypothetical protein